MFRNESLLKKHYICLNFCQKWQQQSICRHNCGKCGDRDNMVGHHCSKVSTFDSDVLFGNVKILSPDVASWNRIFLDFFAYTSFEKKMEWRATKLGGIKFCKTISICF